MHRNIDIEALCADKGLRITEQRRTIARILSEAEDHPDVETLHERAAAVDPRISIATVYRTVRLFEEAGILARHESGRRAAVAPRLSSAPGYRTVRLFEGAGIRARHEFGGGRSRYEAASDAHHDHLIDVETGSVIEFVDEELESLQRRIAEKLGFRLVDHRMELYGVALDRKR